MTFTDLLIGVGATSALVELLRHDGRLAELRTWAATAESFWARALACPFCASHWAAIITACGLVLPYTLSGSWIFLPTYAVAVALAFTRYANLLSDATHGLSRSPQRPESET